MKEERERGVERVICILIKFCFVVTTTIICTITRGGQTRQVSYLTGKKGSRNSNASKQAGPAAATAAAVAQAIHA